MIEAGVVVPICRRADGVLRLVLVRRGERGRHGGQLAFPGGKREAGDASLLDTALRETCEEIGLGKEQIQVLAPLPVLTTQSSGFCITPFLVRVTPPPQWRWQAGEIAEVIEAPLAEMADPEAHGEALEPWPGSAELRRVAFYRVGPHRLWGVSYRILQPLLPRLLAGEWDC